jgi:hypothetical protein
MPESILKYSYFLSYSPMTAHSKWRLLSLSSNGKCFARVRSYVNWRILAEVTNNIFNVNDFVKSPIFSVVRCRSTDVSKKHFAWSDCYPLHAGFLFGLFSNLKMEATCSSEILTEFHRNTRRYIPEERTLHNHPCESLKSKESYGLSINLWNWSETKRFTDPLCFRGSNRKYELIN